MAPSLALVHAKYSAARDRRGPDRASSAPCVFPSLALLFFVVPQRGGRRPAVRHAGGHLAARVRGDVERACSASGWASPRTGRSRGIRTCAPCRPRASRACSATSSRPACIGLAAILPVIVIGGSCDGGRGAAGACSPASSLSPSSRPAVHAASASASATRLPSKAAIAVVQVVMFGLAFAGGLFLPPLLFADWLNTLSMFTAVAAGPRTRDLGRAGRRPRRRGRGWAPRLDGRRPSRWRCCCSGATRAAAARRPHRPPRPPGRCHGDRLRR